MNKLLQEMDEYGYKLTLAFFGIVVFSMNLYGLLTGLENVFSFLKTPFNLFAFSFILLLPPALITIHVFFEKEDYIFDFENEPDL